MVYIKRANKEVTKEELEKFVKESPFVLSFDGARFTQEIKMKGGIWKKPHAAIIDDKYYIIEDL